MLSSLAQILCDIPLPRVKAFLLKGSKQLRYIGPAHPGGGKHIQGVVQALAHQRRTHESSLRRLHVANKPCATGGGKVKRHHTLRKFSSGPVGFVCQTDQFSQTNCMMDRKA